ncbi:MAG: hypothetical protein ACLP4V_00535 [Methylocella sp.]
MIFIVYVRVTTTNRNPLALADTARRQANYLGPQGFRAMRRQTDASFKARGYHRLVFRTRSAAKAFQLRVDQNCDRAVVTKRYRIF